LSFAEPEPGNSAPIARPKETSAGKKISAQTKRFFPYLLRPAMFSKEETNSLGLRGNVEGEEQTKKDWEPR
jgi:hypothetical protein